MRFTIIATLCLLIMTACSSNSKDSKNNYSEKRAAMEVQAQEMLQQARSQLTAGQCEAAKNTVNEMRSICYLALDAREEGILLMDSIDLKIAQNELSQIDSLMRVHGDSLKKNDFEEACRKVQFYERKIQHDRKK